MTRLTRTFRANVLNPNAPRWAGNTPTSLTLAQGDTYDWSRFASDPNGNPLTYSLINPPSGYSISAVGTMSTGTVSSFGRVLYDNFSTGSRAAFWTVDSGRNPGTIVSTASDGGPAPLSGGYMWKGNQNGAVAWNDPAAFDTLILNSIPHNNEYMGRVVFRVSSNFQRTAGSAGKLFRVYYWTGSGVYHDLFCSVRMDAGLSCEGLVNGVAIGSTYWGTAPGDNSNDSNNWHTYEWYVNYTTGTVKVWLDNILVKNNTGFNFASTKFQPFYLMSNFSDPHDAENHVYVDSVEFFSDTGTGGSGSMSDGTAQG